MVVEQDIFLAAAPLKTNPDTSTYWGIKDSFW